MLFHRDLNSFWNRKLDGMRIAQCQDHVLAFYFGAVADTDDIQILLEALRDAGDRIGDKRARQAVKGAKFFRLQLFP